MYNKASLALGVGMMALSAWAVISAMHWPWKAALFPLALGITVFCLATAEVLWELLGSRREIADSQAEPPLTTVALRRTLIAAAWILAFFAAIALLGFPVAVPLFVFLYVKVQGKEGWMLSLIFTAVVWAVFYGLFDSLLHLPFPAGWLLAWLGSN